MCKYYAFIIFTPLYGWQLACIADEALYWTRLKPSTQQPMAQAHWTVSLNDIGLSRNQQCSNYRESGPSGGFLHCGLSVTILHNGPPFGASVSFPLHSTFF